MSRLTVGNLPTVNQDEYPALGDWWVQVWDGDRVVARAYGDTPEAAHDMAKTISACDAMRTERDAAQAEIERLRAALARSEALYHHKPTGSKA